MPLSKIKPTTWRTVLWREAFHCGDAQFAERLITLITRFDGDNTGSDDEEDAIVAQSSPFSVWRGLLGMGGFLASCFLIGPRLSEAWYRGIWGLWCVGIMLGTYFSFMIGWTGEFWLGDLKQFLLARVERKYQFAQARFSERPYAVEIEAAIQQALFHHPKHAEIWGPLLNQLQSARQTSSSGLVLRQGLASTSWSERFLARHQLATSKRDVLAQLQQNTTLSQQTLTWLSRNIRRHDNR